MDAAAGCTLCVKWSGQDYVITGLTNGNTVRDLKNEICRMTSVLPERQKLLGIKYQGKPPDDSVTLGDLGLKPNSKIMMMGTKEEVLESVLAPPESIPEVINDFDIEEDEIAIENREEYVAKIERRVRDYKVNVLNEPRPGKKLLVLDVDYTLFDHRSSAETGRELMRPYLHEFLTSAYEDFDIVIWSATSMKWIEEKMKLLGVSSNPDYRLCFLLDSLAMITVQAPKYGLIEVKPLGVIWGKYPQWSSANTVMFDDIRRNFIMNPQSGLKIRPFKNAHSSRAHDKELLYLKTYLKNIAQLDDFTTLNHKAWEKYKPWKKRKPEADHRSNVEDQ